MNRRHLLIDRCLAGALTQDEWLELSEMIGKENVVRIQQGDKKLRDALLQVSLDDARDSGNSITMDDPSCVGVSYPTFWVDLARVRTR